MTSNHEPKCSTRMSFDQIKKSQYDVGPHFEWSHFNRSKYLSLINLLFNRIFNNWTIIHLHLSDSSLHLLRVQKSTKRKEKKILINNENKHLSIVLPHNSLISVWHQYFSTSLTVASFLVGPKNYAILFESISRNWLRLGMKILF